MPAPGGTPRANKALVSLLAPEHAPRNGTPAKDTGIILLNGSDLAKENCSSSFAQRGHLYVSVRFAHKTLFGMMMEISLWPL
jgi:hypothetical protein